MISNNWLKYFFLYCLLLLLTKSCTVSYSFTGASIPLEAKTYSIYPVKNVAPTVNTQLSAVLHQKLTDKMLSQTNLGPVDYNGDLTFDITITSYDVKSVAIQVQNNETSAAAQNRLTIRLKVKYTNRYDKEANFEQSFSEYIDYDSGKTLDSVEGMLVDELSELLATKVFNKALVNW